MVKKIKWNKAADRTFDEVTDYLQTKYSTQSAENFANLVYSRIDQVAKGLTVGRLSPKTKSVMILKLDKHKQMYYRLTGTTLTIVDFWDTRQDPNKRPY
jgi:plasmid stabilization system protein ParE